MNQRSFTKLCHDCQFNSQREKSYALSAYSHMRNKKYEELAFKSRKELYKDTIRSIRRKNSINFLLYLFLRREIQRIAKRVVDWLMDWVPEPPK